MIPMQNDVSYKDYLRYALGRSDHTIQAYLNDLDQYKAFCGGRIILEQDKLEEWLVYLQKHMGMKGVSCNRKLAAVRKYGEWLVYKKKYPTNPFAKIPRVKTDESLPTVFASEEVEKILAQVDRLTLTGKRDYAMLLLFYATALRLSTLVALNVDHVVGDNLMIPGEFVKNRSALVIPIVPRAYEALADYLKNARPMLASFKEKALFVSNRHRRMSVATVKRNVGLYIRRAGLTRGSVHTFRHTCLTLLHEAGVDVFYLQQLAGHKSLNTTRKYVRIASTSLKRQLQLHPVNAFSTVGR